MASGRFGRPRRRLTYANVVATLALFAALGGGSYAAVALPAGSVGSRQLRAGAVTPTKLAFALASSGVKIANGSALPLPSRCAAGASCLPPAAVTIATTPLNVTRRANVLVIATATFMNFGPAGDIGDVRMTGSLGGSEGNVDLGGGSSGAAAAFHPVSITYEGFATGVATGRPTARVAAFSTGNTGRITTVNITLFAIALPAS